MMVKAFVGNKCLKRVVEIRIVNLATTKSKNFSIQLEEGAKEKDYDIKKIKILLEKLLNEYIGKNGGQLKLK